MAKRTSDPSTLPLWRRRVLYAGYLAESLARYPKAIATLGSAFRPDPTVGINGPWWNRYAIRYLDAQVKPGDRVFEWGSGGSTAWLVSKGADVTSIEHDMAWVEKVKGNCPEADLRAIAPSRTGTIEEPWFRADTHEYRRNIANHFPDIGQDRFFDDYVAAVDEFPDDTFDLVIVDGMCRVACFHRALPKVRPGGLLVVDDSNMPPFRSLAKSVSDWKKTSFVGFKSSKDVRQTTFFRRPR